jgi:predicted TPR repeat methyltransferase
VSKFNKDYFENGIAKKISCYENYRWMPELTYPMTYAIVQALKIKPKDKILEYGCAHGFLVRALNDFNINAFGCDISEYAISNCPNEIKKKLFKITLNNFSKKLNKILGKEKLDHTIAKDVFEHIAPKDLEKIIKILSKNTKSLFVVVPLGDDGKYRIKNYAEDATHIIAENENWWKNILEKNGFKLINFKYQVNGIKDKWIEINKKGNGFLFLKSIAK